jgi:hypothetical protein
MGDAASTAFAVLVGVILLMALYAGIVIVFGFVIGVALLFLLALAINAIVEFVRGLLSR